MKFLRSACGVALSVASVSAFGVSRPAVTLAATQFVPNTSASRFSTRAAPLQMSSASDFAKAEIENNKVVIFSKSFCPFCKKTKKLFNKLGVEATIYELNEMDDGADIQDALLELSGQKTVPNVFINGKHVGGNDDVQAANKSGELAELLN